MTEAQTADAVLLVRPAAFGFHAEAAVSNAFASVSADAGVRAHAIRESERLARALGDAGVEVLLLDDRPDPGKPDAVFPNNWVSFHADGTMVLYPMATAARRLERDAHRLEQLLGGFAIRRTVDLSRHELEGRFLEGTGSLILDRPRRRAFASLSARTDATVVADFDRELGYSTELFEAFDRSGRPIYHTNVLLSLGTNFAVLCTEAVAEKQRAGLIASLEREVIEVSFDQMRQFACNILELRGRSGPVIALSATALASFTPEQRRRLESFADLIPVAIPTIEAVGGGSVRCMIADVHLPRR